MGHYSHMPSWLTAILPVVSALLGVVVANRASASRDAIDRLWQHRADTCLELLNWAFQVENAVQDDETGTPYDLEATEFSHLQMKDELLARVWAFASGPVRDGRGPCRNALFILSHGVDKTPSEYGVSDYLLKHQRSLSHFSDFEASFGRSLATGASASHCRSV